MKILAGVYPPSGGSIVVRDKKEYFSSPADSIKRGIQIIYQDLAVADNIDVVGNVFLGRELTKRVCDRVVVLKGGRKVCERNVANISREELRKAIVEGC